MHVPSSPAHTTLSVQQFLTKNSMTPLPCPPYSPNLTPRDLFLFSSMKKALQGKCFDDLKEVKQKMAEALKSIRMHELKHCFEQSETSRDKCASPNGEYFEDD